MEAVAVGVEHGAAGDIGRQQVGCELHALGAEVQELREALDQLGFSESRQAFEQNVTAGEHAGEDQIDQFLLAEQHLVEAAGKRAKVFGGIGDFRFGGVVHGEDARKLPSPAGLGMKKG